MIAILVPCHRVISNDGKLINYNGGVEKKEFLLKLEKMINKTIFRQYDIRGVVNEDLTFENSKLIGYF